MTRKLRETAIGLAIMIIILQLWYIHSELYGIRVNFGNSRAELTTTREPKVKLFVLLTPEEASAFVEYLDQSNRGNAAAAAASAKVRMAPRTGRGQRAAGEPWADGRRRRLRWGARSCRTGDGW